MKGLERILVITALIYMPLYFLYFAVRMYWNAAPNLAFTLLHFLGMALNLAAFCRRSETSTVDRLPTRIQKSPGHC